MTLTNNKITVLLIFLAFAFSFAVRLIWVQQFSGVEQFKFNNEFMINTNDGYYWAEGARDILAGKTDSTNDLSPIDRSASIFTAWLAKVVPFSFETLIFYMPAFFSSLIVIPIILIAREFNRLEVGFIAALVGSIAWSYYNRTMIGYYDTDFLNIFFPTVLLWSLIWSIKEQDEKYFLIAALDSIAYRWWYPQSYSLEFAFVALLGIYVVYQFFKKQDFKINLILIAFMLIAIVNLDIWIRLIAILAFFLAVKFKKDEVLKFLYYIFGFSVLLFIFTGGLDPIIGQLKGYVFRDSISNSSNGLGLNFFSVVQTVREAGTISFETFANRVSGHTITLIASIIGYIWFAFKHPVMLLALPMVGLGFLAYGIPGLVDGGGLRFTVYAVPVMALGLGYIIFKVSELISIKYMNENAYKPAKYLLISIFTILALYPNIKHVIDYKVPTVLNNQEVQALDKLKTIADREDYVVTWWDYGYPIRYYADVKTLIDGGKHSGSVNFPVSFILTQPQDVAAKMARLDVEYTEKRFELAKDNAIKMASSNIEQMILDYGYEDANDFLTSLSLETKLPPKTRDVYLYLPNRMLNILPTVALFSNLDLMDGNKMARPFFYQTNNFQDDGKVINLGSGVSLHKDKGVVQIGKKTVRVNNFVVTEYDKNMKLHTKVQTVDPTSPINIVFMKSYNTFLVLDSKMYNSSFIQMFVLENYNKKLYELVIASPFSKIYRLKI